MRALFVAVMLSGSLASAETASFDALQKAVPAGWTVLETEHELVLRHDRPCYSRGGNVCTGGEDGPLVTFELRFHTEPKWTQKQLDAAKEANDKVAIDLMAARDKYRVDTIAKPPKTAEEKKRLSAFEKDQAALKARTVKTPLCTFGEYSVFDSDSTYAPLKLKIDPPQAMVEAHAALAALKKQCGAL